MAQWRITIELNNAAALKLEYAKSIGSFLPKPCEHIDKGKNTKRKRSQQVRFKKNHICKSVVELLKSLIIDQAMPYVV